jgi:flagellar biosynthesis protein FlhF
MRVRKVQGNSVKEAMKKATAMYGDEISLIETKNLKGGIFNKSKGWEVVISLPEESEEEIRSKSRSSFQNRLNNSYSGGFDLRIGDDPLEKENDFEERQIPKVKQKQNSRPSQVRTKQQPKKAENGNEIDLTENAKKILEITRQKKRDSGLDGNSFEQKDNSGFPVSNSTRQRENTNQSRNRQQAEERADNTELNEIRKEMSQLKDTLKLIQNMFWEEKHPKTENNSATSIPPEFSEIYKIAKTSGMNQEHLDLIMKLSIENMPHKMKESSETVKRYFKTILRKMIPVRAENLVQRPNKKIIMFVGSTGVGKTTTIAKLAARFTLEQKISYKVGFLVLDTYKIGALEQLTQYAKMMKLQIDTVASPTDFGAKLESMLQNDYIFIDTMGSSPYDLDKINMLKEFLEQGTYNHDIDIEVTMVLPSSLKYEDLKAGYDSFSALSIDTIIFTKLDETKGFGNIFSLVHEVQKPISYFSVGQEVPEDIIVAKSDYLVNSLLNGFKRNVDGDR